MHTQNNKPEATQQPDATFSMDLIPNTPQVSDSKIDQPAVPQPDNTNAPVPTTDFQGPQPTGIDAQVPEQTPNSVSDTTTTTQSDKPQPASTSAPTAQIMPRQAEQPRSETPPAQTVPSPPQQQQQQPSAPVTVPTDTQLAAQQQQQQPSTPVQDVQPQTPVHITMADEIDAIVDDVWHELHSGQKTQADFDAALLKEYATPNSASLDDLYVGEFMLASPEARQKILTEQSTKAMSWSEKLAWGTEQLAAANNNNNNNPGLTAKQGIALYNLLAKPENKDLCAMYIAHTLMTAVESSTSANARELSDGELYLLDKLVTHNKQEIQDQLTYMLNANLRRGPEEYAKLGVALYKLATNKNMSQSMQGSTEAPFGMLERVTKLGAEVKDAYLTSLADAAKQNYDYLHQAGQRMRQAGVTLGSGKFLSKEQAEMFMHPDIARGWLEKVKAMEPKEKLEAINDLVDMHNAAPDMFDNLDPTIKQEFMDIIETGTKDMLVDLWHSDPLHYTPILAGIWLKRKGGTWATIGTGIQNHPMVFWGGVLSLLALPLAMLFGGDDDDDDDDDETKPRNNADIKLINAIDL